MNKCPSCKRSGLSETLIRERIEVGGWTFEGQLPGWTCKHCDEALVSGPVLGDFERKVAVLLAERGALTDPDAFRFARKAIGMKAAELATLLDVSAESVSKWENGKHPIPRSAASSLASLVVEHINGRHEFRQRLEAFAKPLSTSSAPLVVPGAAGLGG